MMTKRGLLFTLEGVEGAGKSTLINDIREHLVKAGHQVVVTREPGGTETGEQIRDILLHSHHIKLSRDAELLLLFASRAQHIQEVIQPALDDGHTVLCDRFTDSSYAYQGAGRGIADARIQQIEDWVQQGLKPDLTFLFDVDAEIGLQRARKTSNFNQKISSSQLFLFADRIEQEKIAFFKRIRDCYLARAQAEPARFRIIDAAAPLDGVRQQIQTILKDY